MVSHGSSSRKRVRLQDPSPLPAELLPSAPPRPGTTGAFLRGREFLTPEIPRSLVKIQAKMPGPWCGPLEGVAHGSRNGDNRPACLAFGHLDPRRLLPRRAGRDARTVARTEPRPPRYSPGTESAFSLDRRRSDTHLPPSVVLENSLPCQYNRLDPSLSGPRHASGHPTRKDAWPLGQADPWDSIDTSSTPRLTLGVSWSLVFVRIVWPYAVIRELQRFRGVGRYRPSRKRERCWAGRPARPC